MTKKCVNCKWLSYSRSPWPGVEETLTHITLLLAKMRKLTEEHWKHSSSHVSPTKKKILAKQLLALDAISIHAILSTFASLNNFELFLLHAKQNDLTKTKTETMLRLKRNLRIILRVIFLKRICFQVFQCQLSTISLSSVVSSNPKTYAFRCKFKVARFQHRRRPCTLKSMVH